MTTTPSKRTIMPIMSATLLSEIPWCFIAPHEVQALKNHGQTLERLASRGGLAACEAIDILEGRPWNSSKHCIENEHYLINKARQWRAEQQGKAKDPSACTCPSGNGSLSFPCPQHPPAPLTKGGQ